MWKPVQEKKQYAEIIVDGVWMDHCGHRALTARVDDGEESIKKRICIYHEVTEPLENYYALKGLLRVVNASQPAAVVTEQLESLLSAEGLLPVLVHSIQKDIESEKLVYIDIDERGIEMGIL